MRGIKGREAVLDSLEAEGFTREEASSVHGCRGYNGALDSLVKQGYSMKEAPSEKKPPSLQGHSCLP